MKKFSSNIFLILSILGMALFLNLGNYGVIETSDARYAEIAREMFHTGDFIHPDLLNIHHYHKPPFTYQITALGYKLFGVNSFGARFFLQLSVLLQVGLVYLIALLLFHKRNTAILAAVIYSSFPLVLISSRNLTTDSFLTTFVLLSIYAWLQYYNKGKIIFLYLFALAMGLGFYTKGPVIFIVTIVFIGLYLYFFPKQHKFKIHYLLAFLLFFVVGFWWYLYLAVENSDFIQYFLGKQTLERFAKNAFNRAMPWWYFLVLLPLTAAPWFFMLPLLIKNKTKELKENPLLKLLSLSVLIPLFFFSLSTSKRILYILPFYVFIALIIAYFIEQASFKQKKISLLFLTIFYILLVLGIMGINFLSGEIFISVSVQVFSILTLFILLFIIFIWKGDLIDKMIYNALLFTVFLLISSSCIMSGNSLQVNSPKPLTDFIKQNQLNQREIYIYNSRQASIAFELDQPIISLYKDSRDLNREVQFEKDTVWKKYLINLNQKKEKEALLLHLKNTPSLLISYKAQDSDKLLDTLSKNFTHHKKFGPYLLFY